MKTMNSVSNKVPTLPEEELAAALAVSADDDDVFMTSDVSTIGFNVCKCKADF